MPPSDAHSAPKAVLVISSHVIRGSVGNRAAVFALETLGHPVWAVPTIILPWHPGHGPATRSVLPPDDFTLIIDDLCRAPWLGEIGAILTGYLGNAEQAGDIARLIGAVRQKNPDALYVCDPVMGDKGGLYVPEATARAIRDLLIPLASIATPNRFELEWMYGSALADNNDMMRAATALGPKRVLVTSAIAMMANATGNLLISGNNAMMAEHQEISNPPNGLGDLLAAVFLAQIMNGLSDEGALQKATSSVFEILTRTARRGADELVLESETTSLVRPFAMVQIRRIIQSTKNAANLNTPNKAGLSD